jgi:hypothetical protein
MTNGSGDELATLSTNSLHRLIDGADHSDLIFDEGHAGATTQATLQVVSSVRVRSPLEGDHRRSLAGRR